MSSEEPIRRPRTRRHAVTTGLVALAAGAVLYYHGRVRPALRDWGATRTERERTYLGDGTIPRTRPRATYAISIAAPPADVWPWLVQMGAGRAGWYGHDLVDNGGRKSATKVLPQFQALHEGEILPMDPAGRQGLMVLRVEQDRHLVLGRPPHANGRRDPFVWAFHLEPRGLHGTRLIVRTAGSRSHPWAAMVRRPDALVLAPLMQRRQLIGIKRRAERLYAQHRTRTVALDTGHAASA